jgi:hypothetical protein
MKRFGLLIIGLALFVACSKDEEKELVDNSEPAVPMTNYVMTGVFEGEWDNMTEPTKGRITVNNEYIIIDELPAEGILKGLLMDVQSVYLVRPEIKEEMADSIGNIFFAESYKYPKTNLEIKYEIDSFSEGNYWAKVSSIKNMWSDISTVIESPVSGETIVIGPPEPNTISFSVEADGVPYRIDLVSKDHECDVSFNMNDNPWSVPGMWIIQYWFNTYRIYNLQTGKHWDIKVYYQMHRDHDTEDTVQLIFNATKLKGSTEERVIFH